MLTCQYAHQLNHVLRPAVKYLTETLFSMVAQDDRVNRYTQQQK